MDYSYFSPGLADRVGAEKALIIAELKGFSTQLRGMDAHFQEQFGAYTDDSRVWISRSSADWEKVISYIPRKRLALLLTELVSKDKMLLKQKSKLNEDVYAYTINPKGNPNGKD